VLLLLRIFQTDRRFKLWGYMVLGYNIAWIFAMTVMVLQICWPFELNWDPAAIAGSCGDQTPRFLVAAAGDLVGDLVILALPMPWVWRLHANRNRKIGISCVFGLGIV